MGIIIVFIPLRILMRIKLVRSCKVFRIISGT